MDLESKYCYFYHSWNFVPYNDSTILITIISCDYLNLSVANEYVGDVTIQTQIIMYNQCCYRQTSQSDCSIHIKLNYLFINLPGCTTQCYKIDIVVFYQICVK